MADETTLQTVFLMQDRAAGYNEAHSDIVKRRLGFVSDAVSITTSVLSSPGFRDDKQHALRALGLDALSSVAASVRLALWGDLPDSIALLRCALETCAILAAAVETQEYDVVTAEMLAGRMRKYSYRQAISRLGDAGSTIGELHGRLSNIGAHSSGARLKFASYELNGQSYDRVGAALDPSSAELALFYAPDACLHLLESIEKAYSQDSKTCPWANRLSYLRQTFGEVKAGNSQGAA
jgi:hypothetical protein